MAVLASVFILYNQNAKCTPKVACLVHCPDCMKWFLFDAFVQMLCIHSCLISKFFILCSLCVCVDVQDSFLVISSFYRELQAFHTPFTLHYFSTLSVYSIYIFLFSSLFSYSSMLNVIAIDSRYTKNDPMLKRPQKTGKYHCHSRVIIEWPSTTADISLIYNNPLSVRDLCFALCICFYKLRWTMKNHDNTTKWEQNS